MTEQDLSAFPIVRSRSDDQGHRARFFLGLQLDQASRTIWGTVVRVLGRGLSADLDVISTASCRDERVDAALAAIDEPGAAALDLASQSIYLAESAADLIQTLTAPLSPEHGVLMAVGLGGFGHWQKDLVDGFRFNPRCDTALLSKLSGLTVIDDFPARDRAYGGRGGPLEAAGFWMLLADRGVIPGRRIRALVELDQTLRLTLLPPRQPLQLPTHLLAYDLAPAQSLLNALVGQMTDQDVSDIHGKLAVQGRHRRSLLEAWQTELSGQSIEWTPSGRPHGPFVEIFENWTADHSVSLHDLLCTATHLLTCSLSEFIKTRIPRSQPIGQLILSGPGRHNAFFVRQIKSQLSELEITTIDQWIAPADYLPAAAMALLAQLHADQIPANSPGLTGADSPRILGRLTPGNPINWHAVLADMAQTLPNKLPLRNAM